MKNADTDSIKLAHEKSSVEIQFTSIGAGQFPISYGFYFGIAMQSATIKDARAEAWDNNVIIQLDFNSLKSFDSYQAGLSRTNYNHFSCPFTEKNHKPLKAIDPSLDDQDDKLEVAVESKSPNEVQIEIIGKPSPEPTANSANKSKKQKKNNKKNRSFSESHCDELLADIEHAHATKAKKITVSTTTTDTTCFHQKLRTGSESSNDDLHTCEPVLKGILKRRSSYNRSTSDCSADESTAGKYSCSVDLGVGSFSSIPEERGSEMSESVRKTVTFDKNLCRKLLFK